MVGPPRVDLFAVGAGTGPARVKVYNAIGSLRFDFLAYDASFLGGVHVATGDVTGDGVDDIITGAGPGGGPHVKVFDGVSGAEIRSFFAYDSTFHGGVFVGAGDINNDTHTDIITGAGAGGGPHVKVFSGVDTSLLRNYFAYTATFTGGVTVAGGDVNHDGFADIITGAGPGGGPHVTVQSGATGALLQSFFAFAPTFTGGVFVAAGDTNGDGFADIIVSAGAGGGPHVIVFSGANGSMLRSFFAYDATFSGGVRVAAADIDGDGLADIITGAGTNGGPHVRAFRGTDGSAQLNFFGFDPTFLGGVFVG